MNIKYLLGFLVISFLIFVSPVLAREERGQFRGSPRPSPARTLSEVRLRACEAREEAVQTRMGSLLKLSEKMKGSFDSIAMRVQNYYLEKVVPSGKTLSNYDDLVADIAAKKAVVDSDLAEAGTKVNAFNCDTDDPKGLYNEYRLGMQKVKTDLRNYRVAIKNLIVAVRGIAE